MMLANQEGSGEEAAMAQGMAGFLITLSCLNEEEWQTASPALDLPPERREAMQCVMNMLGGPEGIAASLESKEGEPPPGLLQCGSRVRDDDGRTVRLNPRAAGRSTAQRLGIWLASSMPTK